jgi:hypothetical protein
MGAPVGVRFALFAAHLLAAMTLAGCAGGQSGGGPASAETSAPAPEVGRVAGRVLNEEFLPVVGAEVAIRTHAIVSRSDEGGNFVLRQVPAGSHVLEVSALGYLGAQRTIRISDSEVIEDVELVLSPTRPPLEPFDVKMRYESFLSCTLSAGSLYSSYYTQFCGFDPNNQPHFVFPVDVKAGLVAVLLEMEWMPNMGLDGEELRQSLWNNIECSGIRCQPDKFDMDVYGETQGPSPLRKVYGSWEAPLRRGLSATEPDTLVAIALIKKSDSPSFVFQQRVTHHVTVFYNSEPDPDYTALAD